MKPMLMEMRDGFNELSQRLDRMDRKIVSFTDNDERSQRLKTMPGVGPVISTALVSSIGNSAQFKKSREFAVWLGLAPRQFSSGDSSYNAGITKRGNRYFRKLLEHGARGAFIWCKKRDTPLSRWASALVEIRGIHKATVAMAHKLARIAWALLAKNESFKLAN